MAHLISASSSYHTQQQQASRTDVETSPYETLRREPEVGNRTTPLGRALEMEIVPAVLATGCGGFYPGTKLLTAVA